MKKEIEKYYTIKKQDLTYFDGLVESYLEEGWELYGDPYAVVNPAAEVYYHQTMVKYKLS